MMEVFEAIKTRRTIRKFLNKDITNESIVKLLEAARYAPSSQDSQPWEFIIVRNQETKNRIAGTREENNQVERTAKVLIIICVDTGRSKTRWIEDGSIAAENLILAATELGLTGVWVTGWCGYGKQASESEEAIKRELNLPDNIRPVCSIALGYPAEEPKEKEFRNLKEMMHYEKW